MNLKRIICSSFVAFFLLSTTVRAATDDAPRGHHPLRKFSRGVANLVFGFLEVPNQYSKVNSEHGGSAAVTYGITKGLTRWIGREFVGVYEILTFPVPLPEGYLPVMRPEFPAQDLEP